MSYRKCKFPFLDIYLLQSAFYLRADTDIVFVAGGKWTTYREMAQDAVDKVNSFDHIFMHAPADISAIYIVLL